MNQKFLIILIVLTLSVAAFLSGYLISQNGFTKQSANLSGGSILNRFDENQTQKNSSLGDPFALSRDAVLSPTLSKEKDSVVYYDRKDGKVFQISPRDLQEKLLSATLLPNLIKTVWSPTKKEVVSVFYDNNGERFKYYNYQTRKAVDLGPLVRSAVFSPDGSHLTYFRSQGQNGTIYISSPDGDSPKKIFETRITDLELYWPSPENLAFKTRSGGSDKVYILSTTGELSKVIEEDGQVELLWSSDGNRVLYSVSANETSLWFKDFLSSENKDLVVSTTASKCSWGIGNDYVVCSVPRSGASGEDIYKIGLDGTKELLASPQKNIVAKQLMLTVLEEFVIILNNLDGKLYALKI